LIRKLEPSCDLNEDKFKPAAVNFVVPKAFSVRASGTPAASAISVPRFKNSRRELLICFLLESCLIWACGRNGAAVYFFSSKLAIEKTHQKSFREVSNTLL
jgi:hypothetical protein